MSGDRQSAIELSRRAPSSVPFKAFAFDDLYQAYQAQQQAQQLSRKNVQPEQILQEEINRDVSSSHFDHAIGF